MRILVFIILNMISYQAWAVNPSPSCSSISSGTSTAIDCSVISEYPEDTVCYKTTQFNSLGYVKYRFESGEALSDGAPQHDPSFEIFNNCGGGGTGYSWAWARTGPFDYEPPADCTDKAGQSFVSTIRWPNDEGAENGTECYFSCQGKHSFDDEPFYQCTFSGATATENPEDPEDYINEDTNDPAYCNNSNALGECIDFDHPDNEGGCGASGKWYGTFGTEFGPITGCFGGGSDYEPGSDRDGDGIPNDSDDDIDGDGILNEDDPDEDGDGFNEKKDTDGDGIPDSKDPDIDGDGIPNGSDVDKDGDGINNDDETDKDEESKGVGKATTCAKPPSSTGDPQLAAIHQQLWLNRCSGDPNKSVVDKLTEISDKFDELTEEASDTLSGDISDGALSDGEGFLDDHNDALLDDIEAGAAGGGPLSGVIDDSGILDRLSLFPQATGCSPMQIDFANKFSGSLSCDHFNEVKGWVGWALMIVTMLVIFEIALKPVET